MQELIRALRCTSTVMSRCMRKDCRYWKEWTQEELNTFLVQTMTKKENYPEDFFAGCDCDAIALEAADVIERMIGNG